MKIAFVFLFLSIYSFGVEYKSNLSAKYLSYQKYHNELQYYGDTAFIYSDDKSQINTKLGFLYSNRYEDKRYLSVEELYFTQRFATSQVEFGKMIKYWGELEGYNLSDIYNQKNPLFAPFDTTAKSGTIGANLTTFSDNNSFEVGAKLYEEDTQYPKLGTPYSPTTYNIDNTLQSESSKYNPTLYLKVNFVTDKELQSDSKIIFLSGYDTKRYFIPINQTTISEYGYKVNKLLLLSNILYEDTIFKGEASFTDVTNDEKMSDYAQIALGVENGFYDIFGIDVNLYSEYYRYFYKDNLKIKNVDMGELYDDDLFLALKCNFNDTQNSVLKSGVLLDRKTSERLFKIEFERRIEDGLVFKSELQNSVTKKDTFLSNFGNDTQLSVAVTVTF